MTPQEEQMIDGLIGRVRGTQLTDRDPDAAARLQLGLGNFPDALYILAQTVLVQQNALEQAHTQMDALESQLPPAQAPLQSPQQWQPVASAPPAPGPAGWLSRFFGTTPPPPQPTYAPPQYAQPYPPSGYAPNPYGTSAGGSFLRSAAQTAAGVVAGEMLFTGLESMFGGHHGGGFGNNFGSGMGGGPTIINEYGDHPTSADSSFYNPIHDASRSTDVPTTTGTDDAASDNFFNAGSGDSNATDDASSDDFFNGDSSDDSSDFDSSSDDSGGGDNS